MPQSDVGEGLEANQLLAELLTAKRSLLLPATRIERPEAGLVISGRNDAAADIWFPLRGVIGLTVTDRAGRGVEAGIVGPDGCIGLDDLFAPLLPMAEAWIQVSGPMAVIPASTLRALVDMQPLVQTALSRYLYSLSAQCLQTVACNRLHNLEQRCCRWLLMLADCLGSDDVPLTQDALATILDSSRPRINALLASLEHERLLRRSRGRIRLVSRIRLQQTSCECYRLLRRDAGAGLLPRFVSNVA